MPDVPSQPPAAEPASEYEPRRAEELPADDPATAPAAITLVGLG